MKFTLGTEEVRCINLFEVVTGAGVKDCVINGDRIMFVVSEGDIAMAIGKKGSNIKQVEFKMQKKIDVIEF